MIKISKDIRVELNTIAEVKTFCKTFEAMGVVYFSEEYNMNSMIKRFDEGTRTFGLSSSNSDYVHMCSWSSKFADSFTSLLDVLEYIFSTTEISVKLNDSYKAVVSAGGIKVGCQSFTFETFDQLAEAVEKIRRK